MKWGISDVASALLGDPLALLEMLVPGGSLRGHEYVAGSLAGGAGRSFSVNTHTGKWSDFATGESGTDLVSLAAASWQCGQWEAAQRLNTELRLGLDQRSGGAPRSAAPAQSAPAKAGGWVCAGAGPQTWASVVGRHPEGGQLEHAWPYLTADGSAVLQVVCRYRMPDGSKDYRPWTWRTNVGSASSAELWRQGGPPEPRPLYRLDLLAARPFARVLVCEGEKAADAAQRMLGDNWVCTTSPAGAKSAGKADWAPVNGRAVLIWPDHDEPGAKYAQEVAKRVAGSRVVDVAAQAAALRWKLEEGCDAADLEADQPECGPALEAALLAQVPASRGSPPAGGRGGTPSGPGPGPAEADEDPEESGVGDYAAAWRAWTGWVALRGVRPDAAWSWTATNGKKSDVDTESLRDEWTHQYRLTGAKLRDADRSLIVSVWERRNRQRARKALVSEILDRHKDTNAGMAELRAMIRAWTGKEDPLQVAVMAHFLWQVRRRAAGLPCDWDLMPVLYGPQGSGKTTAVERLCSVWHELDVPATAQQLTDAREGGLLATALVARWDELSGTNKVESDAIKRTISQATLAFRKLHTHDHVVKTRTVTLIGTSNLPVHMVVRDTSGARRFAQIEVKKCDHDAVNAVDYALVWQAVSEHDAAPILPFMDLLRAHQRSLVQRDQVTAWLEADAAGEVGRGPFGTLVFTRPDCADPTVVPSIHGDESARAKGERDPGGWSLTQVSQRLAFWGRDFGRGQVNIETIAQRLIQMGWEGRQMRVGSGLNARRERRWFPPAEVLSAATPGDEPDESDQVADLRRQLAESIAKADYRTTARIAATLEEALGTRDEHETF